MSILIDKNTRVICQGITGKSGRFHTLQCKEYGTQMVGGVTPGKGGESVDGIPVYNTVREAVQKTGAAASMVYVPAAFALTAVEEACAEGIRLIIVITEGIPVLDMIRAKSIASRAGARIIGPNCPGVITPEACKIGIMPGYIHKKGPVGIISRSGTLTYEAAWQITSAGLGQSTCIGIGGDPIIGTNFIDCLELFGRDDQTEAVLLIGEIGGTQEEEAAVWIKKHFRKKAASFIAGTTAPEGKRMGHAGAIISGSSGTAQEKYRVMRENGITLVENPSLIGSTFKKLLA